MTKLSHFRHRLRSEPEANTGEKSALTWHAGFTLVELAIVIAIIGFFLGGLLVPLATQVESRKRSETKKSMEEVKEALYGYAISHNRLVCPDDDGDGQEDRSNMPTSCTNTEGNIPWVDLGVEMSDAWGQHLRYRVTGAFADDQDGTPGASCTTVPVGVSFALCSEGNITVWDAHKSTPGASKVADKIPAIVLSGGKNWAISTSPDELENGDGNSDYVSKGYSAQPGREFDDLVVWISPHILKNRMVTAGKLP